MVDGLSFGGGKNIDFSGFNGISQNDLQTDDAKKKKLSDAIFKKYDQNEDGVLDKGDLQALINDVKLAASGGKADQLGKQEAKTYLTQTLGLTEGEYNRQDLEELLELINADKDSISDAQTDEKTGNTTITYKPDQNGQVQKDMYDKSHTLTKRLISNDKEEKSAIYNNGAKISERVTKKGQEPVYYTFKGEAGQEKVVAKYRQKGAVTEYLDNQDRVTHKITQKGQGLTEEVYYIYGRGERVGYVTETTYQNNRRTGYITKLAGQEVSREEITYDDATKQETHIITEGQYKKRAVYTQAGQPLSAVEIDNEGNVKPYEHTVDKENDTWYGIVQAKYGVTDHKTTMEIIHQLKNAAGIDYKSKTMPDTITLPPTITLKNGQTIGLKDVDAQVNENHNVQKQIKVPDPITPPAAETVPADKKTVDLSQFTPPHNMIVAEDDKTLDFNALQQKYPKDPSNAGKMVKIGNEYVKYDDNGNPSYVFDHEPERGWDANYTLSIVHNDDGTLGQVTKQQMIDGKQIAYEYDDNGKLSQIIEDSNFSEVAEVYTKRVLYKPDGTVKGYFYELYDDKGNQVAEYSSDFEFNSYELDENGNNKTQYNYDTSGNLKGYTRYTKLANGNDDTITEYDANGNVLKITKNNYRSDDTPAGYTEYDAQGNVIKIVVEKRISGVYHRKDYEYDKNGNLIQNS